MAGRYINGIELETQAWQWWFTPVILVLGRQRQVDFLVQGQPGLQNEFQDSQSYTEKPCLRKKKIIEENFLNLKKDMPIKVQEVYRTPNRLDQKRKFPYHIVIK